MKFIRKRDNILEGMLAASEYLKVRLKRKVKRRQSQSIENKIESPVGMQRRDALIDYAEGA